MNRRMFLKALASVTGASIIPQSFSLTSLSSMYRQANAAIDYKSVNINAGSVPDIMPQVINVFLYGGPSELAGNLSNIDDINTNSQLKYTDFFGGLTTPQGAGINGSITPSGFWGGNNNPSINNTNNQLGAGGDDMQFLVDNGHMTVYRTMMKRKNTSQSHRENILMSQKGSLDVDFAPGFGFKLAALISENRAVFEANTKLAGPGGGTPITDVESLIMPFISISDGDTRIYDKDNNLTIPVMFNGISVNTSLGNPFTRSEPNGNADDLEALAQQVTAASTKDYSDVVEAFQLREELSTSMAGFETANLDDLPTLVAPTDIAANGGSAALVYPDTSVGRAVRAAVTMAIENPGSLLITLGGAFGGWDDHNNGVDNYPTRMRDVFTALRVAMMHIKYSHNTPTKLNNLIRPTDNIIINVFGDFGRRVNLNNSLGWNHGNNQNFYTLGGSRPGLRTAAGSDALGNVVGTTMRVGEANQDNQFTQPTPESYEFEPMSVAANIYKHFGVVYPATVDVNTPDPLTSYEDPANPGTFIDAGSPAINEDPATNGAV